MLKSMRGLVLIIISLGVTAWAWLNSGMVTFLMPGLALTALTLTFMLATRNRLLENWFHGIETMYFYHKVMAVMAMTLLAFHYLGMFGGPLHTGALVGQIAFYLFISIICVAFIGKKLKYEVWRFIHRFVFLAYLLGLYHVILLIPAVMFSMTPLALIVDFFAILGLASGLYMLFFYQWLSFKTKGTVRQIKHLTYDTLELEIELNQDFDYEFGQFTFIKILEPGFEKAPHPFSISGGHRNVVYFTIKGSGDHTTQLYKNLKIGSQVKIDRAYGHMKLTEGRQKQVWIAGGIGITPFISYIRENPIMTRDVEFFYAYTGHENAVYTDMLTQYAQKNPNFKLRLVDSKVEGFLNFDDYVLSDDTTIFMCGPVKMMNHFAQVFKKKNTKAELIYEGFSFR